MVTTKAANLSKNQALTYINDFFVQFQDWYNRPTPPSIADLEKYLSKNFHLSSNDQILARSVNDYLGRVNKLRQQYSHIDITGPLEEPLVCDNCLVIHYDLSLRSRQGKNREVCIMAVCTLEDQKISRWLQVTHDKGSEHWDRVSD